MLTTRGHITPAQLKKAFNNARIAVGRKDLRFKDLRHLLPTALAKAGVDRRMIEALLGHAPGSRVTDRYITPAGEVDELDKAARALGFRHLEVA